MSLPAPAPARAPRPTHLVLSGGGLAGLSYVGVLKYLSESGLGADITHVSGTSMGAWFATAFALGISSADLDTMVHHVFRDPDYIRYDPTALLGLMNTCLLYTSPSPRDLSTSRMPSSA